MQKKGIHFAARAPEVRRHDVVADEEDHRLDHRGEPPGGQVSPLLPPAAAPQQDD
ncbi:MAG: hypothetical protein J6V65_04295 [Fibrobacterales bacterium]|nr:hypothetical protein [Fibrobacterales bacterium]